MLKVRHLPAWDKDIDWEIPCYKVIGLGKTGCSALDMVSGENISFISIDYDLKSGIGADELEMSVFDFHDENMTHCFEEKLLCPWFAVLIIDLNDDFPQDKLFAIAESIKSGSSFSVAICISENEKVLNDSIASSLHNKVDSCFFLTQECLKHFMITLSQSCRGISNTFVLAYLCQSLFDLLLDDGTYSVDHYDLKFLLGDKGIAGIGLGVGQGENRAKEALMQALKCPALQRSKGEQANEILACTYGPPGTQIEELEEISTVLNLLEPDTFLADLHAREGLGENFVVILIVTGIF